MRMATRLPTAAPTLVTSMVWVQPTKARIRGFPTTGGAYQGLFGGGFCDAFVTKLNSAGTARVYSTYLGGNDGELNADFQYGIAVDGNGSISNSIVTDNGTGLSQSGSATVVSRTNSTVEGNTANTAGSIGTYLAK